MNWKSTKISIDRRLSPWLRRLSQSSLVRDTLWMALAQGLGIILQMAYFVTVARTLGPKDYGTFISITALASILFPFVSLGTGDILVKQVSRDRSRFAICWGNTLLIILVAGLLCSIASLILVEFTFVEPISPLVVLAILVTDLLFLNLWDAATKAFVAVDRVSLTARIKVLLNFNKLLAAIVLVLWFREGGILVWAGLYLNSTAISAFIGLFLVQRTLGKPRVALSTLNSEWVQGFYFSISSSADGINSNIDKTMLASLATLEATGLYAAANRCVDVGYLGLMAIAGATYAKFFQQGATGIRGSLSFAKRLFPVTSLYGVVTCLALFVCAPLLPQILGDDYEGTIEAVRWFAPVPLLLSLQFLAADTLTGAGLQGRRSLVQIISALVNVGLNLWLIPLYSWRGAVWATLVSESIKLLGLYGVVAFCYYQEGDQTPQE